MMMPARIVPRSSELLKGAIQSERIELSRVVPESESRGAILGTSLSAVPHDIGPRRGVTVAERL